MIIPGGRRRAFTISVVLWVASSVLLYDEWQRRRRR